MGWGSRTEASGGGPTRTCAFRVQTVRLIRDAEGASREDRRTWKVADVKHGTTDGIPPFLSSTFDDNVRPRDVRNVDVDLERNARRVVRTRDSTGRTGVLLFPDGNDQDDAARRVRVHGQARRTSRAI